MRSLNAVLFGKQTRYVCNKVEAKYICENTVDMYQPNQYVRQGYDMNNPAVEVYVKTWVNKDHWRCNYELNATTILLAKGSHPNLLLPLEVVDNSEGLHFVYPLLQGVSLEDYIDTQIEQNVAERDFGKVLYVLESVAAGLAQAHNCGLVHNDVKPDNIFLKGDSNTPYGFRPTILDWDVVSRGGEKINFVCGTLAFIPPEQLLFGSALTFMKDLYALGTSIYIMLEQDLPLECGKGSDAEIVNGQLNPYRRKVRGEGIPLLIREVVDKMVAHDISERYQSLDEMVRAFREAVNGERRG